jgi:hypothetical protein
VIPLACSRMQLLDTRDSDVSDFSGQVLSSTLHRQSNIFKKKTISIIIITVRCAQNAPEQRRQQRLTFVFLLKNFLFETGGDSDQELIADLS